MKEDSEARKKLIYPDLFEPIEKYGEQSFVINAGNTVNATEFVYQLEPQRY